jgi:hypothetical protein
MMAYLLFKTSGSLKKYTVFIFEIIKEGEISWQNSMRFILMRDTSVLNQEIKDILNLIIKRVDHGIIS